jgi:tetratricopeptide (TPR) repeat protein
MAQFRPGAVAYHLHSYSARVLRVNDSWWAGPLIGLGATATMGCTEEPYLQTTPEPHVFLSRFVLLGFSFGEAAYACQRTLSWQNTVIGDPLYRPFRKTQQERFAQLEASKSKDLEWSILMWIDFRLAQGAPLEEIERFYQHSPECKNSAVLQEKLGDLYQSRGKLFDASEPYANALKLPMNPLQKLRVTLSAASVFTAAGKDDQAYALLKEVLQQYPNYPDKKSIYERLERMARDLQKDGEAAEFGRLAKQS